MEPLVSVIVPVYGVEAWLEQCVDSILQQSMRNLEILLIDDGSPDRCPEICDAYAKKDERVRVIHQQNAGVSAARNAGLDAAKGDYIAFVDGDDWIAPDMIETLLTACERDHTDLAFCRIIYVKEGRAYKLAAEPSEVISAEDLIKDILMHRRGGVNIYNKLYKAKLFEGIRFPEGARYEEEPVFYPVIRKASGVSYTGTANYYYRQNEEGFCYSSFTFDRVQWKREHRKVLEKDLQEHDPQLLPLLKYHAAFADFELLRFYMQYGGNITAEQEQDMRESFEKSFPELLEMLQIKGREKDRRDAILMRLGLWDSIREMREKAIEAEKQLPEEIRQQMDPEHDGYLRRILREGEYSKIEDELKKAEGLKEQKEKLQKENKELREQVQELLNSHSYKIGRTITQIPGLLKRRS